MCVCECQCECVLCICQCVCVAQCERVRACVNVSKSNGCVLNRCSARLGPSLCTLGVRCQQAAIHCCCCCSGNINVFNEQHCNYTLLPPGAALMLHNTIYYILYTIYSTVLYYTILYRALVNCSTPAGRMSTDIGIKEN